MIDLHCHILPGVDDGAIDMEETIAILKKAKNAGFHTICFTPHYAEPQYLNTKEQNSEILKEIEARVKEENLKFQLLLGNEIFIGDKIEEFLKNGMIATLANSRYALVELPMYQELPQEVTQKLLERIREQGFEVVIAHPERYRYIQKNPKKLLEYFGEKNIFQGNYASIIGVYGKEAKETMKKLLKDKQIHYLASDVHHIYRCFYDDFACIQKKLLKVVDKEYFEILTETNPKLIIENKEIVKDIKNGEK